jgi:hypothetical protein
MPKEIHVIMECPRCGAAQEDFDGFGVLHCPACGFCVHPSFMDGRCNFCGDLEAVEGRKP